MKYLIIIPILLMTACTTPNGLNATAASTTATVVGTVVGGPVVGIVAGGAAGITADILTPPTSQNKVEVIETIPEADRASVLKWEKVWMAIEHLGIWLIVVIGISWILPDPIKIVRMMFKKE